MIPLLIVCGRAGSGKDSFGGHVAEQLGGVCIGLADPMKRFMAEVFQFDDNQLYGPSKERDRVDLSFNSAWDIQEAWNRLTSISPEILRLFGNDVDPEHAKSSLYDWFRDCERRMDRGEFSPRFALQTFGTEWGRSLDPEVWSRTAVTTARRLLGAEHTYDRKGGLVRDPSKRRPPNLVVITDGRFANEIINVKSAGGVAYRIFRPEAENTATSGVIGHVSEAGLDEVPAHFYDEQIRNDGTLEDLQEQAVALVKNRLAPYRSLIFCKSPFSPSQKAEPKIGIVLTENLKVG